MDGRLKVVPGGVRDGHVGLGDRGDGLTLRAPGGRPPGFHRHAIGDAVQPAAEGFGLSDRTRGADQSQKRGLEGIFRVRVGG